MKSTFYAIFLSLCLGILLTSCLTTKTSVGAFAESEGQKYTYAKGKQMWLFWGMIPVGRTNVNTPGDGACQVITRFNVVDFLISGITGGILTTETIKVVAKRIK